MDLTSIITIIVAILIIYVFIKFVINPIIKAVLAIVFVLIVIYLLQKYLNFDVDKLLAPFGISLNFSKWSSSMGWLTTPINLLLGKVQSIFNGLLQNVPK